MPGPVSHLLRQLYGTAPPVPSLPNHCPPVLPPHVPPPDHPSCSVVYRGSGGFGGSGDRGNRGPESTRASAWNVGERSTVEGGGEFVKDRGSLKTFALGVGARNCCTPSTRPPLAAPPQLDLRSTHAASHPPSCAQALPKLRGRKNAGTARARLKSQVRNAQC